MEATCEILYKLVGLWNRHTCLHKGHFLFEICLYNSLAQLLQYPPYHFDLERFSTYMATRKQHSVLQHGKATFISYCQVCHTNDAQLFVFIVSSIGLFFLSHLSDLIYDTNTGWKRGENLNLVPYQILR